MLAPRAGAGGGAAACYPGAVTDESGRLRGLEPGDPTRVGRYRVLRRLGVGGMAVVYNAYDPDLDRNVALKLVDPERLTSSREGARLQREAQAMARVSHPNVVPVYDVGEQDRGVYIAMELVEGDTLKGWLSTMARPWNEVLGVFMHAGRGLAAAHAKGLVHRDFKPENVLIGTDGRPRVLDFGLARPSPVLEADDIDEVLLPNAGDTFVDMEIVEQSVTYQRRVTLDGEVTTTGLISGTPAYMAPEQHLGMPATHRSDQFAYCVALWEALYLERPFPGRTAFAIADAVIEGRINHTPKRTRVPAWVRNILLRGLAKEPEHRFESMSSLMAAMVFTSKIMAG